MGTVGLSKNQLRKWFDLRATEITRQGTAFTFSPKWMRPFAGYRGLLLQTSVCLWASWLRLHGSHAVAMLLLLLEGFKVFSSMRVLATLGV